MRPEVSSEVWGGWVTGMCCHRCLEPGILLLGGWHPGCPRWQRLENPVGRTDEDSAGNSWAKRVLFWRDEQLPPRSRLGLLIRRQHHSGFPGVSPDGQEGGLPRPGEWAERGWENIGKQENIATPETEIAAGNPV